MSEHISPIETRYAGCRFRSRLEARWAVFFDAVDLEWQYEPQGFETPYGPYLPDFYIPAWRVWIEVKGELPSDLRREEFFAKSLPRGRRGYEILAGGIPRPNPAHGSLARLDVVWHDGFEWIDSRARGGWLGWDGAGPEFRAALERARSARFEHGEQPRAH